MPRAKKMIRIKKDEIASSHQSLLHIDDKYDEIRKFQASIQSLQLIQCSVVVTHFLLAHKTEDDVEIDMKCCLFRNDEKRHFVSDD
jgi:hypothetical protein